MAISLHLTTYQKKVFDKVIKEAGIRVINGPTGHPDITTENYNQILDCISEAYFKAQFDNTSESEYLRIINERLSKMPFEKKEVISGTELLSRLSIKIEDSTLKAEEVKPEITDEWFEEAEEVKPSKRTRKTKTTKVKNEEEADNE